MVHCWKGNVEDIEERFGQHSPEHLRTYEPDFVGGTCMLLDGHDGPHEFTPDGDIRITFAPEAP